MKGPVCYISTVYNLYRYRDLSKLFLFILPQDTPDDIHLLLVYFNLEPFFYFIMFYL